jgi:hypothetical protein
MIYETKGLSLEQVDEMYADKSVPAWRSASWQPTITHQEKANEGGTDSEVVVVENADSSKKV